MKTEVIMKRPFLGDEISQKSKSEFLSATDLLRVGNRWRMGNNLGLFNMSNWLQNESTKEFIRELESIEGCKVKISGRGRGNHTWMHPLLFMDMALAINPKLKVQMYKWLHDHLLKTRAISGESYKKMCGSLYSNSTTKTKFHVEISKTAKKIQDALGVDDWNRATEDQLAKRDDIHKIISAYCNILRDNDKAVDLAIYEVTENKKS